MPDPSFIWIKPIVFTISNPESPGDATDDEAGQEEEPLQEPPHETTTAPPHESAAADPHPGPPSSAPSRLARSPAIASETAPDVKPPKRSKRPPATSPPRELTTLNADVYELLDNRIHDAIDAGTIDVLYEDEDLAENVEITYGELNRLRRILFAEGFRRTPAPKPTTAIPGSAAKAEVMAARAAAGESTTSKLDADPLADDSKGVEVLGTGKGARLQVEVLGLVDDKEAMRPEGCAGAGDRVIVRGRVLGDDRE